jgi:DNA-binding CsgD family transcriptional regulator
MADTPQTLLTATELVVADLAVRGRRNDEIAEELGVTPAIVRRHLAQVYGKLGVQSRAELMSRVTAESPRD